MSRRYERNSFRGLSIIEGQRSIESKNNDTLDKNNNFQLKQRTERRRRSSSLQNNTQIRDIIAKTVAELNRNSNGNVVVSPEERLKKVLAEAKESGYSSDRIFGIIGKTSTSEDKKSSENQMIPTQIFIDGLKTLGYECSEDESSYVTDRFDLNNDGMISLEEFKHFCYNDIQSVAWKAERQRLQAAAATSRDDNTTDTDCTIQVFDIKEIKYAAGNVVHSTSKLFWKDNISVNIQLRYCSDLDILSLQTQNANAETKQYKTLYIKKSDVALDSDALNEAVTLAIQTSDDKTNEGQDLIRQQVTWEAYSNYLTTRLQLTKDGDILLAKLHGDVFTSLDIDKPSNLIAPQARSERRSAGSTVDDFNTLSATLQSESRSARNSRQSAQELSSIIESALQEILAEDAAE